MKEVEAGRGTPYGGAYRDFRHVAEAELRGAFGPVIDRLLTNGIDLTKTPVEVGPMAHYHMGGVRVGADMQTRIAGLYAAGEAVGGANGANRLSGNAITEAFVFGERAGSSAARNLKQTSSHWHETAAEAALERLRGSACSVGAGAATPISLQVELQKLMWENAGPFRSGKKLSAALALIEGMGSNCRD